MCMSGIAELAYPKWMSGIREWAYLNVCAWVALESGGIQMYVHEWHFRVGISKCSGWVALQRGHIQIYFSLTQSFRPHYGPRVDSASNRNEYQEYFLGGGGEGGKGGRCVGLTTLPPSCADCREILEPQPPGTLRACPCLYRDCFTFTFYISKYTYMSGITDSCVQIHALF